VDDTDDVGAGGRELAASVVPLNVWTCPKAATVAGLLESDCTSVSPSSTSVVAP